MSSRKISVVTPLTKEGVYCIDVLYIHVIVHMRSFNHVYSRCLFSNVLYIYEFQSVCIVHVSIICRLMVAI